MKKERPVSIIIPTLDRGDLIINTLDDLLSQNYENFEIIIVDQSDIIDEGVQKYIKKHKDKILYFHLEEKGTPNAKNIGSQKSKGEILIFIDDDVEIKDKNFINKHVANYEDPFMGGIGGRVVMDSDVLPPEKIKEVGKFKYFGLKEVTNFNANFRSNIDHVYGCNQSFLKKAYDQAGGFQKVFKGNAHLEEADLSFRVKRAGYKLVFDPKPMLKHLHYQSGGCRVKDTYELRYWLLHNYTLFYLRNYPKILFPVFLIKQLLWTFFSSLKRLDYKMYKNMTTALLEGYKYYLKLNNAKN